MEDLLVPEIKITEITTVNESDNDSRDLSSDGDKNENLNIDDHTTEKKSDDPVEAVISVDCFKELESIAPETIPEEFSLEELAFYGTNFGEGHQKIQFYRVHCTACNVHLGTAPVDQNKRYIHPLLKVIVCRSCYDFYTSGEFVKDEDGSELYCRWCGEGGNVLCCAQCPFVFCKRCILRNLGRKKLEEVKESDDWLCFVCNPSQMINLRVICRALYEFTLKDLQVAKSLNNPERLNKDEGLCCQRKVKTTPAKRKRTSSTDLPYSPFLDNIYDVKKKPRNVSLISQKTETAPVNGKIWDSQEEDEVVCTPDLFSFINDEPESEQPTTSSSKPSTSLSQFVANPLNIINPPPLAPLPVLTPAPALVLGKTSKTDNIPLFDEVTLTKKPKPPLIKRVVTPTVKLLGTYSRLNSPPNNNLVKYTNSNMLPNVPVVKPVIKLSNSVVGNGQSVVTVTHNFKKSTTSTKLVPGLKHTWFDRATRLASRVNQNLSTKLESLSVEQGDASTLEELANVHNKLQETLSSSINSLIQIRKNLRTEFLNGLNSLKFTTGPSTPPIDDDDVICIDEDGDSGVPAPSEVPPPTPEIKITKVVNGDNKKDDGEKTMEIDKSNEVTVTKTTPAPENTSGRYIKVRPLSSLINPIGDVTDISGEDKAKPVDKDEKITDETKQAEPEIDENLNPEVMKQIEKALKESELEKKLHDTLKVDLPTEELKKTLSVKVVLKKMPLEKMLATYRARVQAIKEKRDKLKKAAEARKDMIESVQDIEQLLAMSVVNKPKSLDNENNGDSAKLDSEDNSNDPQTVDSGIDVASERVERDYQGPNSLESEGSTMSMTATWMTSDIENSENNKEPETNNQSDNDFENNIRTFEISNKTSLKINGDQESDKNEINFRSFPFSEISQTNNAQSDDAVKVLDETNGEFCSFNFE